MEFEQFPQDVSTSPMQRADYPAELRDRFFRLITEVEMRSDEKVEKDPYLRGFCEFMHQELSSSTAFDEILFQYYEHNPEDDFPVTLRKLYSSFQELVMPVIDNEGNYRGREKPLLDEAYPRGYDQAATWKNLWEAVQDDPLETSSFRWNFILRHLQSNIISRAGALIVAAQLYGVTTPNIYSGGPSFGFLEMMRARHLQGDIRLPDYTFGHLLRKRNHLFVPSDRLTDEFNSLLYNPAFSIGKVIGADLDPPKDPVSASYAYSNSFRGPEFLDAEYRRIVADFVFNAKSASVYHKPIIRDDFSSPTHVARMRQEVPEWFELPNRMAEFVHSQYALPYESRQQANRNARELVGEDGHIIHMEWMRTDREGRLRRVPGWPNWLCNLFVTPPGGTPQHVFRMRNGRALDIAPGKDLIEAASTVRQHPSGATQLDLSKLEFGMMVA